MHFNAYLRQSARSGAISCFMVLKNPVPYHKKINTTQKVLLIFFSEHRLERAHKYNCKSYIEDTCVTKSEVNIKNIRAMLFSCSKHIQVMSSLTHLTPFSFHKFLFRLFIFVNNYLLISTFNNFLTIFYWFFVVLFLITVHNELFFTDQTNSRSSRFFVKI